MAETHGGAEDGERGGGGGGGGGRRWEDLSEDILVTIFARLELADLIAGVPFVCTAWRDAVRDPACWLILDFRDWDAISRRLGCRDDPPTDFADLLDFSIARSDGFFDSIFFPNFADANDLLYVADRCPELLYFSIENPDICEEEFCKAIGKFEFLKGMAVDESLISHKVLLHVDQSCSFFTELKVFADPLDVNTSSIICECLPYLRKLEIRDCTMSRDVILMFLDELKVLEYLDISGYENSGITGVVFEKASRLKVFQWDSRFQEGEFEYCSNCQHDWLYQNPCVCVLDQEVMEWLATLN